MNTLIIISVLPIVLLYLGLYKMQKALLPVTIVGLLVALGLAVAQWQDAAFAAPEYHGIKRQIYLLATPINCAARATRSFGVP